MVKQIVISLFILSLIVSGCAQKPAIVDEQPIWKDNDTKSIVEPDFEEPSLVWISTKRTSFDQVLELLDVDRNIRKIFGNPTEAKNINSIDEVPNSSWFTNRHGYPTTRLAPSEIEKGYHLTDGPDVNNSWQVFRPKQGGATPGFWIEDSRGDQYIIKFDPDGFPELATAAAAMGSRYFYACGYNTAQETIVYWHPDILKIREGATYKDKDGNKQPLTLEYINNLLKNVERQSDGSIRSLASLNLGNVKGPFLYEGTKEGDINDWCPHEHRRELRGLFVIGSLVNHYDLKDHNSMDVYIGEDGEGYLKHYLMDFGSTFGSDGRAAKVPRKGYANMFDLRDVLVSTATLGIKSWAWEYAKPYQYRSIGYFEADLFEPDKFDPITPNPAFEQITNRDGYWGAKVVMAFSDDDLKAIVNSGQFSDPKAAEYLLETLIKRRDKIGRHWLSKLSPLDYFDFELTGEGLVINFEDLAVRYNLEQSAKYQLSYQIGNTTKLTQVDERSVTIKKNELNLINTAYLTISLQVKRENSGWLSPVEVTVKFDHSNNRTYLTSVKR